MKTKLILALIMMIISGFELSYAQEIKENGDTKSESGTKVVVNKEIIDRFNQCDTEGKLVSWSELITGYDTQSLSALYFAYLSADFENQTLDDIRLTLENNHKEHLDNSYITDNDLAWFNQVKQEINNKLKMTEMAARQ